MNNLKVITIITTFFLATTVFSIVGLKMKITKSYQAAIPEKIKIDKIILQGQSNTPLIFTIIPSVVRSESCGGAVFKLSESTLNLIKLQKLNFFRNATTSRNKDLKYHYSTWKQTPVPSIWTSEGAWTGLDCIDNEWSIFKNRNTQLIRKITQKSALSGSYYTNLGSYRIVVLPELGFLTFTYAD